MTFVEIFVFGAGIWRICSIIMRERGWFDVFVTFREKFIGIQHDEPSKTPIAYPDTNLGRLFECMWCFSTSSAIVLVVMILFMKEIMFWIMLPFALSAIAVVFEKVT